MNYISLGFETEQIEFKKSTSERKEAMDDISAILNKHGKGTLYFGVKPNGNVCGQEIGANTLDDIATIIKAAIKPTIFPSIEIEEYGERKVVKVSFSGCDRPYSSYGRYFKRVDDRSEEMTPDELRHMMLDTDYSSIWENHITNFTIDDIDSKALKSFYDASVECHRLEALDKYDEKTLLSSLGLLKDDKLTNAGFYLFSKNKPVVLKMCVCATDERIYFIDINRVSDNIYNLIDIACKYIISNMKWKVEYGGGTKRNEIPEVSVEAIREIVVNSFAHASYTGITEHSIVITPSIIEIYNPGEFPINYTPLDFVSNSISSITRNPKILEVLYRSKNVEVQGSGFKKVFKLCEQNNKKVYYESQNYGFRFMFKRTIELIDEIAQDEFEYGNTEAEVANVLALHPEYSAKEIAGVIHKAERTVMRALLKLKNDNAIERTGSKKTGRWIIKER